MSKFQKVDIDTISNIEKLREKLRLLLEDRTLGKYSEEEEHSCYDALEKYYEEKTSGTDLDMSNWRELKPEVIAIILEDMLCFPNRQTEHFMHSRDLNMKNLDPSSTVECGSAISNHLVNTTEQSILHDYVYLPTFKGLEIGTSGISSSALLSKFKRTVPRGSISDAQACAVLAERLETIIPFLRKMDSITTKNTTLINGNPSILDVVLRDTKISLDSPRKVVLFQSPRIIANRLNFLNYLNTSYNAKKKYDTSISFGTPQQFVNLMLVRDEKFLEYFDYEISDMMGFIKFKNNELGRKISYSKMEELLLNNPFIRKNFLANNKFFRDLLDENPSLLDALSRGEKEYSVYSKSHLDIEERMKDIARTQFRRLFMNGEFGTLTEPEKEKMQYLSKEAIEISNSSEIEEASYTVIDMTPNEQRSGSSSISHLPPVDSTPKRRRSDKYNPLKDPIAREFITHVISDDISYDGVIGTNVGTKVGGRDKVYYFVFSVGENGKYKVLEPIGQPHNATFVIQTSKDVRELAEILSKKKICLDRLVANKEAIRIYHSTKQIDSSDCPNRLRLIAESLRSHGNDEDKEEETEFPEFFAQALSRKLLEAGISRKTSTLDELADFSTQRVKTEELPILKAYIAKIYQATDERQRRNFAKKVTNVIRAGKRA